MARLQRPLAEAEVAVITQLQQEVDQRGKDLQGVAVEPDREIPVVATLMLLAGVVELEP